MNAANEAIVKEMLDMLGGTGRLSIMINAKDFVKGEDENGNPFLMFRHMKSEKNKANKFKITYDVALDLYNIEFWRVWGAKATLIKELNGVYVDMIHGLFRDETGLALSLR